ncbi:hypothetical protein, variant 1 [Phialophora macrospora]|uniref:Anaphase-promoting complex subunit 4 WD40 domain-containing protein n=1 Tax=Phialophora macrospora TaxID=1851006 RepID=A0A0D2CBN9_9EURO|nr:hypothetical protein, variant 1 [Phialophora macrospora]
MDDKFDVRLLTRSLGETRRHRSIRTLYGDKTWVEDLDIVNELGAHSGCVNALSWSSSGNLLASGSDDTHLNIWDYNPSGTARTFSLNTSVSTGHHANIFSVKFMPHSGDRTVVTCAGDSEVRVFDLEYGGAATQAGSSDSFSASTRSRRFNNYFQNARWLNEGNTNCRVYRSHADRVKRIVTESSPYLFLTCSEDGEVRQWDLRQPSSAYPAPRGGRGARFRGGMAGDVGDTPPPLISYKKHALDLNSISCAPSQPQYIALGGAHLHCFLHDRRMLGRDLNSEKGLPASLKPVVGSLEDEAMAQATRCVRRFAPNNKRKSGPYEHGHITACKISDANPNEMLASWSGDHIYSFDIVKSPDAREVDAKADEEFQSNRLRHRSDRKRKRARANASSSSLGDSAKPSRRLRRAADDQQEEGQTALLARYGDGGSELISVPSNESEAAAEFPATAHDFLLSEAQRSSERVARSLVQLRKTLFDFSTALSEEALASMEESSELTPHEAAFTNALGQCASLLPQMDEIIRAWAYPVNPTEEDVILQNTLRRNRQASWRFVQAAGCLAQTLGGRLQSLNPSPEVQLTQFDQIRPAAHEGRNIPQESRFCYDFLRAILLWLRGGQHAVLQGFKRPPNVSSESPRFPLEQDDTVHNFVPELEAYLLNLADEERPIVDLDTNRFERDEIRQIFRSQKAAVQAFIRALANVRLEPRQGLSETRTDPANPSTAVRVMDKGAAARFWGVKVGRSLLMRAAEGVTFDFVNRAFGGLRLQIADPDAGEEQGQEEINTEEEERIVEALDIVATMAASDAASNPSTGDATGTEASAESPVTARGTTEGARRPEIETSTPLAAHVEDAGEGDNVEEDEHEDNNDNSDSEDGTTESEEEDEAPERILFRRRLGFARSQNRASVNLHVPYSSHTRVYKGHCNTRTVKDVNYYGLNDEYVVSGSDDGHFFIWDRKTSKILNILEGDGEVVNVVQGHPYEPMIACSGIDSTVKIFGSGGDSRERKAAEKGIDVANPGGSVHSSLAFGGRRRARRTRSGSGEAEDSDTEEENQETSSRGLKSRRAMHRSYTITSRNDAERRRSAGDNYVTGDMLGQMLLAIQRGQVQVVGGHGFGEPGGTVVIDDNCLVM